MYVKVNKNKKNFLNFIILIRLSCYFHKQKQFLSFFNFFFFFFAALKVQFFHVGKIPGEQNFQKVDEKKNKILEISGSPCFMLKISKI